MPQDMKFTAGPPAGVFRKAADAERTARIDERIAEIEADTTIPDWRKTMMKNQLRLEKARIKRRSAEAGMGEMSGMGGTGGAG